MRRKPTAHERRIAKALDISDAQLFGLLSLRGKRGSANVGHHLLAKGLVDFNPNAKFGGYVLTPAGNAPLDRARALDVFKEREWGVEQSGFDIWRLSGVGPGFLYPVLAELERKGILTSRWEDGPPDLRRGGKRRRLYKLRRPPTINFASPLASWDVDHA